MDQSSDKRKIPSVANSSDLPVTVRSSIRDAMESEGMSAPKTKKHRSGVWNHFEILLDSDGKETGKAACIWCEKHYIAKSEAGTSSLWKHLRETCRKFPGKKELVEAHNEKTKDKLQTTLSFTKSVGSEDNKLSCWRFDQQLVRNALVRMIIKDELPFRFVERDGFREFCEASIPQFQIPSRFTIVRDCFALFVKEKKKLFDYISSCSQRVSLTSDTWTSIQNLSYICLTAHFVDSDWNMHKRILNFCVIKSHTGINIGNAIEFCMNEWGLKKLMCLTVDNASNNDVAIERLRKRLVKKNALSLGGMHFHMRCCAHILQLIVRDGIAIADGAIKKIRSVVKYVRSSPKRLDMFKQCVEEANLTYQSSLQLDCPTRWNSTYLMLETAISYQKAFDRLEDKDTKFSNEIGLDLPNERDWSNAKILTKFLQTFYEVTCNFSGSSYPTLTVYFPEIMRILKEIELCENDDDVTVAYMGKEMRKKFDKYWGSIDSTNRMLFVAVVLDPRYKIKYLRVKYSNHYGQIMAEDLVKKITDLLTEMIEEYKALNGERLKESQSSFSALKKNTDVVNVKKRYVDEFFIDEEKDQEDAFLGELNIYLGERLEKYTPEFDLLGWWKLNEVRFPFLAKVARDVFAIQASTVASEFAFSTGGRTLDKFRSSLTPITAEVLICLQDWLRRSNQPIEIEEIIEELDDCESGLVLFFIMFTLFFIYTCYLYLIRN